MGLSEVSSNKKEGDSEFILRQLAERVPLSFWCERTGMDGPLVYLLLTNSMAE